MTREVLAEAIEKSVSSLDLKEFSHLFINEVQAIEEFYSLCHNIKCGNTISLLFNPHRLTTDTEKDDISVYESLSYPEKVSGMARLYLYNLEHSVHNAFYSTIQRGYNNIQYVNEFPPFVARTIYKHYGENKHSLMVLDPCAGWGGRMIGCASIPNTTYVACEPSTQTYEGLNKLGEWLSVLQPSFKYKVHKLPYEDFETDTLFDIAMTSPPYYNTEHYSDEETNSLNRYDTFEKWVDGFYTPLILNTMKRIKDNGVFILNVGDRKYPLSDTMYDICKKNNLYCQRVYDYLSGNGSNKEKFYSISKHKITSTTVKKLF